VPQVLSLLRRAALALGLTLAAFGAAADCGGPSLLDRLDPAARADLAAAVADTPHAEGILWSARRGPARILLAGTLHLPDPRHRATLLALAPALRDADLVLLETTPQEEGAMARAVAVNPDLALALEGPVLSDRLDAAAWTVVAAAAQARGIRPADAARFRPWLLMMALSAPPCAAIPGRGGLDRMVLQAALAEGVAVAALEPWDTLFRLLGEGDEALQIEMLKLSLLDEGPAQELLVAMREGYFAGRVAEVWELSRLAARFRPEGLGHPDPQAFYRMEEALLDRRNAAWLAVIEEAARANPRLVVAAGAAHLPGEAGLLRLLEARGWTVEPLDRATCCQGFWTSQGH
jgi:uncharacterized protein YbaP (TraB family)